MTSMVDVLKQTLSYSTFVHAIAGATGGSVALTIFYPLDLARTRLQVDTHQTAQHAPRFLLDVAKDEGFRAWYNGWLPVLTSQCCSNFVYFYAYNLIKHFSQTDTKDSNPVSDLLYAFIAGSINVVITTPLWVVNTRLRLQGIKLKTQQYQNSQPQYHGIVDALKKIYKNEGIPALWSGTWPSLILATNPSIHFMVYEMLKRYFQGLFSSQNLPGLVYFLMGAVSKMAATVATYPLQLLQSQLRAGYVEGMRQKGILDLIVYKIRQEGLSSLYKGMETKLLQTVLTAATMFLVYEKIVSFVFYVMGVTSPSSSK